MRRLLAGLVTLAAVIGMAAPVSAQTVGVVLMHGNTDSPDGTIALLAAAMEGAGYLVTSEAFGLVHAGPVLLVGRENRVVPVIVAQHLGDVLTPARVARHRGVQEQFIRHEEAIAAGNRLVAVKFGRIEQSRQAAAYPLSPPRPPPCWHNSNAPVWSRGR